MKPASAKAKGRRFQQRVRAMLIDAFQLHPDDVLSRSMGSGGEDIHLSDAARGYFPFSVECKNQERLNIWQALKQAEENAAGEHYPAVAFRRNHSDDYIALRLEDLLTLLRR